jgi:hypothetical protein
MFCIHHYNTVHASIDQGNLSQDYSRSHVNLFITGILHNIFETKLNNLYSAVSPCLPFIYTNLKVDKMSNFPPTNLFGSIIHTI